MFLMRTLGVLLLGLGLAGLAQTVDNWRIVDRIVPSVQVYPQGTLEKSLSQEEAQAQFGPTIHEIGADERVEINVIEEHFAYSYINSRQITLWPKEWQAFCDRFRVPKDGAFVIAHRGLLFRLEGLGLTDGNEFGPGMAVYSEFLGRIESREQEYPFAVIRPEQFAEHAEITGNVSPEVWRVFQEDVIGQRNQFVVADTFYRADEVEEVEAERVDLPGASITFKIVAGICLVAGAWFIVKPYRIAAAKEGIHVAGPGFAVFGDAVGVVCTAACAFVWLDTLLFHGLGQAGGLSTLSQLVFDDDLRNWDPVQRDAIYFAFAFGVIVPPALAALVTQRSGQAIRATADGVISDGGFGTQFIPWAEVDDVAVESEHLPTFRPGFPATRRLQKKLVMRGKGCELAINEPSRSNTKRKIVQLLVEQAPELVAKKIHGASISW